MIYFLLPKTNIHTYKHIDLIEHTEEPEAFISNSLSYYLCDIKEKIKIHEKEWDVYKKYTNPYEYLNTIVPNRKKSISKYKPISRSYFKMIELVKTFKLFEYKKEKITTFHLAEGPGGFIEAVCELRNNLNDRYYGMTILDDSDEMNVPGWKKSQQFLFENPNVVLENGADNTGNILHIENFLYCKEKYGSSMEFITADGGFDFSLDFNKQEVNISKLLFAQIAFALCMQKKEGSFVLKIFDSFMPQTIDLLYILASFYEKVYITKPQTSRFANSEKYIVCKNFLFEDCSTFFPFLYFSFQKMCAMNESLSFVNRFLHIDLNNYFLSKLEEYNSIFGQQQIENIYYTISLIETKNKNDKIESLIKNNLQKCVLWCVKYDILYNNLQNNVPNSFK